MMLLKQVSGYFAGVQKVECIEQVLNKEFFRYIPTTFSKRKFITYNSRKKLTFALLTSPICTEL